ncbi:MAG: NAD(P)H-dependent oxidoreductase [Oscillochloridaceae bacterium]|nr:NAD(P)H-dependent oxidoreductase [Chloroflexaceae bacterium]MDW8392324.1 NAD(P)H-dependent oxidoreductase [Oscillochloridaceae bacterium]
MRVVILNGAAADDSLGARVERAVLAHLASQDHSVRTFTLRDNKIGNCAGDFFCWVRSPGQCMVADDNREIAAAVANADLLIYLTPITFGGYSSTLKKAVDHQIQNISPFFVTLSGETHHARRYARYADLLVIGWQPERNPAAAAIFRHLVWRNSLNLYARTWHCEIVSGDPTEAALALQIAFALDIMARGESDPRPTLPINQLDPDQGRAAPRSALLLVGSPRTSTSTSHAIGDYLMQQLEARGVQTEITHIYTTLNNPHKMQHLLGQIERADLTVPAFPLYFDTLPAPVILLLERLAAHRAAHPAPAAGFAALVNCGFPEPQHNANALAVCAEFARSAGFAWLGGLALGGGEGVVHGTPLTELDGRARPLKKALALAAEALARGRSIPPEARKLISRPLIPPWAYRLVGTFGWRQAARRWGAHKHLKRRPYQAEE